MFLTIKVVSQEEPLVPADLQPLRCEVEVWTRTKRGAVGYGLAYLQRRVQKLLKESRS